MSNHRRITRGAASPRESAHGIVLLAAMVAVLAWVAPPVAAESLAVAGRAARPAGLGCGGVDLAGAYSLSLASAGIEMTVDQAVNETGSTTGTLRLAAMAFPSLPACGSSFNYYSLGPTFTLGSLPASEELDNVDSGLLSPFTPPPAGCYFLGITLEELSGGNWLADDIDLASQADSVSGSTCVPDPGGSGGTA